MLMLRPLYNVVPIKNEPESRIALFMNSVSKGLHNEAYNT